MFIHSENNRHIIVVSKGKKLVESLTEAVSDLKLKGGIITGLGALEHVEMGYYELDKKDYIRRTFSEEDYELISLIGNITLKEGKPYCHVHASLGKSDFSVFGGHLFEAVVAVTAEISIVPMGFMPSRKLDERIGLSVICGIDQ